MNLRKIIVILISLMILTRLSCRKWGELDKEEQKEAFRIAREQANYWKEQAEKYRNEIMKKQEKIKKNIKKIEKKDVFGLHAKTILMYEYPSNFDFFINVGFELYRFNWMYFPVDFYFSPLSREVGIGAGIGVKL